MAVNVPSLILAAGGELVGKTRLQKIVYLLDQIGLESGFSYEYHHYGPYSEALADQVEDDVIFGNIQASQRRRRSDGVPYVAYTAASTEQDNQHLFSDQVQSAIAKMQNISATVLELAATIHWLAVVEQRSDWQAELENRKGVKTQGGRDRQAQELLLSLGLSPAIQQSTAV